MANGPLRRRGSLVDTEARFVLERAHRPVKVTMPVPSNFLSYWVDGISDRAYPDRERFLDELATLMHAQARELAAAGVAYLQLDAPKYTFLDEPRLFPDQTRRMAQLAASQPTFGSDRQNAETQSLARRGSQRFFCSSLPNSMIALQPIDWCADTSTAVEPHDWPIRSSTRLYDVIPRPSPPCSRGIVMPMTPRSNSRSITQRGISCSWSISTDGCSFSRYSPSAASN